MAQPVGQGAEAGSGNVVSRSGRASDERGPSVREPKLHRWADSASGWLLMVLTVFSPWAFGGWPEWSVWTMNAGGYALGLLLLIKWVVRWKGYPARRWDDGRVGWHGLALGVLTVALLAWCWISALNARSFVDLQTLKRVEIPGYLEWLPHSFDQPRSWFAFWTYLALAGVFWGARDWLVLVPSRERASVIRGRRIASTDSGIPKRLERLLFVVCLNGALVAAVGVASVWSNPSKILWILPHPDQAGEFFGPFWYRNNGSQFLNLLIPVAFGMLVAFAARAESLREWVAGIGKSSDFLLLPMLVLMMAGTFTSKSRGGAMIAGVLIGFCLCVALFSGSKRWVKWVLSGVLFAGMAGGAALGWEILRDRFLFGFNRYDAVLPSGLNQFTLRWRITVPSQLPRNTLMTWIHEGSANSTVVVRAVYSFLDGKGRWETRLVGGTGEQHVTLVLTNGVLAESGRSVDLAVVRSNSTVHLYMDGREVPFSRRVVKEGREWSNETALVAVHSGRIMGPRDDGRLQSLTFLGRALSSSEVVSRYAMPPGMNMPDDLWANADVQPLVHVSPQTLSVRTWSATGYNGRERYYQDAHRMLPQYPSAFGSGPGTFANLYKAHLHPNEKWNVFWYVHDDHLETRLTFGWGGMLLIYVLLLLCVLPAFPRGGVPVPGVLTLCITAGLMGALVHARKDWVFQMHALLFLGVLWCAVLSSRAVGRRA